MRIGIDLGGTTVKAALCSDDGTLLCKDSLPTRTGNAAGLKADMKTLALSLCRGAQLCGRGRNGDRHRRARLV